MKGKICTPVSRYGEHRIGQQLFCSLKENVWNEQQFYWLQSLELFSTGEQILAGENNKSLHEKLVQSGNVFERGLVALRAGSSVTKPLTFQLEFIKCRILYLQVQGFIKFRISPFPLGGVGEINHTQGWGDGKFFSSSGSGS